MTISRTRRTLRWIYAIAVTFASVWFLLIPAGIVVTTLQDDAWRDGSTPAAVIRWHAALSARYAPWATQRLAAGRKRAPTSTSVSGTEWPLFSSVMYLWSTDALQDAWSRGDRRDVAPAVAHAHAIRAAADLVADPAQAQWVRAHYGDAYLDRANLFYRMLVIAGLDTARRLGDDARHDALLLRQVDSLARELDASPHGVLEDYPGEAYSVDILLAYAAIARASERLGIGDARWTMRAKRAFTGTMLDDARRLPGYVVHADEGRSDDIARGVGIAMMAIHAPALWPDIASDWYRGFVAHFWQEKHGMAGFREFPVDQRAGEWTFEIDAGPVIDGFGTAASAFGLGAARVHGDLDRAFPLAAEAVLAAWPLANGTLLGPRVVSNLVEAPYTGEAALLFAMTRPVPAGAKASTASVPVMVWLVLALVLLVGTVQPAWAVRRAIRRS